MNKSVLVLVLLVAMLSVAVGCGGGDEMTEPVGTQLLLTPITTDPAADEAAAFNVKASNSQAHIVSITLDYTDDGIWDDTRTVDAASVNVTFTWVYHEAGTYTVRAEVRDANDTPTTTTLQVTIAPARIVAVSVLLIANTAEGGPRFIAVTGELVMARSWS
jgi:ABC-type glycerol-3-phosphate transport system substrate-binding protein